MPYEYRKMTLEKREEVVRQRRERGYPFHSPPHPFRQAGRYLLTAVNFEHIAVMASPDRRTEFESRLMDSLDGIHAEVLGWVVLPNHYHVLAGIESLDAVSTILKHLHGTTSREWNLADQQTGKRRVWYKFTDRVIRDDTHFYRAMNYIHINPVKHRYVDDLYEWPWSSIHRYFKVHGREWLQEKWKVYPPKDLGREWDE